MANGPPEKSKSLESWIWDAACSIRGAKDAPKYKDYILPLIFTKRLCDVFDDELNRIAAEVGSRKKAFQLANADHTAQRSETNSLHVPAAYGEPPDGWTWSRLDDVSEGVFDCPNSTPKLTDTGPFVVRTQDIITGVFRADQARRVSEETYAERIARVTPSRGDLLYSREGTYFGTAEASERGVVGSRVQHRLIMIESISISSVATYAATPELLDGLSHFNFMFGSNGTGKTTVSRVLQMKLNFQPAKSHGGLGRNYSRWYTTTISSIATSPNQLS